MNKYVFPGADASCALNWVIGRLEGAGFEVLNCDVLGVHCEPSLLPFFLLSLLPQPACPADVMLTHGTRKWRAFERDTRRLGDSAPLVRELDQEQGQGARKVWRALVQGQFLSSLFSSIHRTRSCVDPRSECLQVWLYFLASSVITSRQGGASVFQITLHKNLNGFPRIDLVNEHASIHPKLQKEPS